MEMNNSDFYLNHNRHIRKHRVSHRIQNKSMGVFLCALYTYCGSIIPLNMAKIKKTNSTVYDEEPVMIEKYCFSSFVKFHAQLP